MKMPGGGWVPADNVQLSTETRLRVAVAVEVTQAPADVRELPAAASVCRPNQNAPFSPSEISF